VRFTGEKMLTWLMIFGFPIRASSSYLMILQLDRRERWSICCFIYNYISRWVSSSLFFFFFFHSRREPIEINWKAPRLIQFFLFIYYFFMMRRQQDSYRAGLSGMSTRTSQTDWRESWIHRGLARGGAKNFNDGQTGHIIPTFMRNQVHRDRINLVGMIKRRR
jgi:hypothetical protein